MVIILLLFFFFWGGGWAFFYPLQAPPLSQANVAEQLAEIRHELKTDTVKKKQKTQQQHKTRDVRGISKPALDAVVPFCLRAL